MPGYLGNFPNAWVSGKFTKCLGISSPRHLRNFQNLKNIPPSNTYRNLGNFPDTKAFGKFPKYSGIWKIYKIFKIYHPQIPFPNAWIFRKFPYSLGICEISQIPWHLRNFQNLKNIPPSNPDKNLGNFLNAWVSGKFHKCLGICEISQTPRHLRNFQNL